MGFCPAPFRALSWGAGLPLAKTVLWSPHIYMGQASGCRPRPLLGGEPWSINLTGPLTGEAQRRQESKS